MGTAWRYIHLLWVVPFEDHGGGIEMLLMWLVLRSIIKHLMSSAGRNLR